MAKINFLCVEERVFLDGKTNVFNEYNICWNCRKVISDNRLSIAFSNVCICGLNDKGKNETLEEFRIRVSKK